MTALNARGERALLELYDQPSRFAALNRYWNDAEYRAQVERDRIAGQAQIDALFEAHNARVRARQEADWAADAIREAEGDEG